MRIGEIILQGMQKTGIDRIQLAERVEVKPGSVQNWEVNSVLPGRPMFKLICGILNLNHKALKNQFETEKRELLVKRYSSYLNVKKDIPKVEVKPILRSRGDRDAAKAKNPRKNALGEQFCCNCDKYFKFNDGAEFPIFVGNTKVFQEFYCAKCFHLLKAELELKMGVII